MAGEERSALSVTDLNTGSAYRAASHTRLGFCESIGLSTFLLLTKDFLVADL
jgi:hypothetical protein